MRQLFISYARENKPDVEALVRHLEALGYQTWMDSSLRGGKTWWEEILRRIAECDVFVLIVSGHTLRSVACKRELEWALALKSRCYRWRWSGFLTLFPAPCRCAT